MSDILSVDNSVYSKEAILAAAYKLSNFFTIDIKLQKNIFEVTVIPNKTTSKESLNHAIEEFRKNLTDEQLREKIKKDTENERNLILGIAFSKTDLQQE